MASLQTNTFAKSGLIFLFSILTIIIGCETDLQDRLTRVENELSTVEGELSTTRGELSTVEGELSTTRGELSTVEGELRDSKEALRVCETSGLGILIVENDFIYSVVELYISPVTSGGWGAQWLGAPIPPSTWRHFGLKPGTYNVKALFSNNTKLETIRTISPSEFTTQRYYLR